MTNIHFWPNQPIHVRIKLDTLRDTVVVPEPSVLLSQQGEFVFVVGPPPTSADEMPAAEMRIVQTGQLQEDGTKVITSGLKPANKLWCKARYFLRPTMPLIVTGVGRQATAAAAPAAASASAPAAGAAPSTNQRSKTISSAFFFAR